MSEPASVEAEVRRRLARFDEELADSNWDSEFTAPPHDPRGAIADVAALGEAAVAALCERTRVADDAQTWAIYALGLLGPTAGVRGADALVALLDSRGGEPSNSAARALWSVAPRAFAERGYLRDVTVMGELAQARHRTGDAARWLLEVIGTGDVLAVATALDKLPSLDEPTREVVRGLLGGPHERAATRALLR